MPELKRELGLWTGVLLVIGNIIGVGIFTTPGVIAQGLPSAGWILFAWVLGGLMATAGALTYAELGAMFPKSGANYIFLKEAYGPMWGFLYGWAYTLVTSAGTIALLAIGFAEYLGLPTGTVASKLFSIAVILILTELNRRDVNVGAGVMNAITSLKVVAMVLLVGVGFFLGRGETAHFFPLFTGAPGAAMTGLGLALVPMAFAYSGWNSMVMVGEEVKNPGRLIPLAALIGTLATTVVYVLMNAVYLYAVPLEHLVGEVKVAEVAATNLFGPGARTVVQLLVATSVLGCLSASMLTNPRTVFALGRDRLFFSAVGRVHPRHNTPSNAILFQGLWACFLVLIGNFGQILRFLSVPLVIIFTMTIVAIFVFRVKRPDAPRPYRCWGYPFTPAVYVLISVWMIVETILARGHAGLIGIGLFIAGIPVYALWKRFYAAPAGGASGAREP